MRRKPSEVTTGAIPSQVHQEGFHRQGIPAERSPSLAYAVGFGVLLAVIGFIWKRGRGRL
jgi:hypothetical protein